MDVWHQYHGGKQKSKHLPACTLPRDSNPQNSNPSQVALPESPHTLKPEKYTPNSWRSLTLHTLNPGKVDPYLVALPESVGKNPEGDQVLYLVIPHTPENIKRQTRKTLSAAYWLNLAFVP